jgi:hypothetical protein
VFYQDSFLVEALKFPAANYSKSCDSCCVAASDAEQFFTLHAHNWFDGWQINDFFSHSPPIEFRMCAAVPPTPTAIATAPPIVNKREGKKSATVPAINSKEYPICSNFISLI